MIMCNCKKCLKQVEVDTSVAFGTNPIKYKYSCDACGEVGYVFVDETFGVIVANPAVPSFKREYKKIAKLRDVPTDDHLAVRKPNLTEVVNKLNELIDIVNEVLQNG